MAVLYVAVCLFGATLYLLSLGPILRYCGNVTTTPTTGTPSVTMSRMIGVIYYPALKLLSSGRMADAYQEYIDWWLSR